VISSLGLDSGRITGYSEVIDLARFSVSRHENSQGVYFRLTWTVKIVNGGMFDLFAKGVRCFSEQVAAFQQAKLYDNCTMDRVL
jgi:hypothetical protein